MSRLYPRRDPSPYTGEELLGMAVILALLVLAVACVLVPDLWGRIVRVLT